MVYATAYIAILSFIETEGAVEAGPSALYQRSIAFGGNGSRET